MNKALLLVFFLLHGAASSRAQEGLVRWPGAQLYYRVFGVSGEPLVILNGGPGMNSNGFADLAAKLAAHNRVILYDQRGTGRSTLATVSSQTITMDLMVADLERLRQHLGISRWVVLGHSFGGILASHYVSKHPARVSRLIYSSSGGIDLDLLTYVSGAIRAKLSPSERDSLAFWDARIDAGDTSFHARFQRGMNLAPAYVYDRKFIPVLARRLTEGNSRINSLVWDDLRRIGFDCSASLREFKGPVLLIQGQQDLVLEKTAHRAAAALPQARVVLMPHCGHYGWLDNPEVYFSELGRFLK